MNKFISYSICIVIAVFLIACNDNDPVFDDYREAYIGIYDCTKSNNSFDDDQFTTDIEVIVVIDSLSDNSVILRGHTISIDEDGKFGSDDIGGAYHELDLSGDKLRWSIEVYNIPGLALPCYIKGEKRE